MITAIQYIKNGHAGVGPAFSLSNGFQSSAGMTNINCFAAGAIV